MVDTSTLHYTSSDEWLKLEGDTATIGITQHAVDELGDIALVQLDEVGRILQQGDKFGEVESIKAVAPLNAPVAGEVIAVNSALMSSPETVNAEPYDSGWLIKLRVEDHTQVQSLLDEKAYLAGIE
jgi:glycine cleavage system H protein